MRNRVCVAVICMLACAVVSADSKFQPLNVKLGQWQVNETFSASGLPSRTPGAVQTITYKSCVTQENRAANPFSDPHDNCNWTVVNSTGSDMEVKGTACSIGGNQEMKADVHLTLHAVDSEHVNGSGDWKASGSGMSLSGSATGSGKWIGATCSGD